MVCVPTSPDTGARSSDRFSPLPTISDGFDVLSVPPNAPPFDIVTVAVDTIVPAAAFCDIVAVDGDRETAVGVGVRLKLLLV